MEEPQKGLTEEQRLRIEKNKREAIAKKRKREMEKETASVFDPDFNVKAKNNKKDSKAQPKVIDSHAGFLIEEEEEKSSVKQKIVIKSAPITDPLEQPECIDCQKKFAWSYLYEKFDYNVCDSCRDPGGRHSLITKTDIKKDYLLNDVDLERRGSPLKFILSKNPHNSNWKDMKLYLLVQVEERALEIWGSEQELVEALEKRDEKRKETKQKSYNKKMRDLRMQVRSSLYTKKVAETHQHSFGPEEYHEEEDNYSKICLTCDFKQTYEKM